MSTSVICLGAINVDLKFRVDDLEGFLREWNTGLTRGGEEAVTPAQEARLNQLLARYGRALSRFGGGQAANTAYALACLGIPVTLVGRVGADADGQFLTESLAGVDLSHVITQGESGRAYILTDPAGERTILVAPNTNDDLKAGDIPWETLNGAAFLHLTPFAGDGPLAVQQAIATRVPGQVRLSLDPGELYARRGRPVLEDLLDHLETLLITETEWRLLDGDPKTHPQWAPPLVIIKRGALGARLLTPLRYLDFPVELGGDLVDTLGAGDVFAAGYLAGRLSGLHLNLCVRLANRAAAVSLGGAGRESYPNRTFLERQIQALQAF
ncbi:MAG: carbohydrate kinase family protein [Syntrophobacterales bacterium]|jgi:ribokinase|nr:carbohydrate kinase family protein [Syntrophobacterales bacterium]